MITKYRNPWYSKINQLSRKWYFVTEDGKIQEYKTFYIITSVNPWVDVVEQQGDEFVCISQVGSVRYAKAFIDHGCVYGDYREKE